MATITDEEAFALGVRAVKAGMQPELGMGTLMRDTMYGTGNAEYSGVIDGIHDNSEPINTTRGRCGVFGKGGLVPDLRDPGTKGHAVAQLRERYNDPGAYVAFEFVDGNEWAHEGWTLVRSNMTNDDIEEHPTEEEAIAAAFEATKETP